jgi:hypothetical protein
MDLEGNESTSTDASPAIGGSKHWGRAPSCRMDGAYRTLSAWITHLPPSAVF